MLFRSVPKARRGVILILLPLLPVSPDVELAVTVVVVTVEGETLFEILTVVALLLLTGEFGDPLLGTGAAGSVLDSAFGCTRGTRMGGKTGFSTLW